MGKKYIATIMDRHYVGENTFVFNCNHVAIGEIIDEDAGIFQDRNGNRYASMLNIGLMSSEIPYAYFNIMELKELKKQLGEKFTLKEVIQEYENLCKKGVYLVGKVANKIPFYVKIDVDELKESILKNHPEMGNNNFNIENNSIPTLDEETEEIDEVEQLILDVINGKYNLKELKELQKHLKISCEDLESALDTVELQIEATENGKTKGNKSNDIIKELREKRLAANSAFAVDNAEEKSKKIDIEELFKKVTKTLIAQDEPARRVITEIARKEMDERKKKEGILLTGSTGVGKTELMRLIAKHLNRPFYKVDSTQLTIPGYVGKDISEVLWDLYIHCNRNLDDAENAIIFFDEIDKKGSTKKSDVSGLGVLNLLLPFIEGATYDACQDMKNANNRVKINTKNMIVILGGAYTDVYKNLLEKNSIGFNNSVSSKEQYRAATTKDFVEKGQMPDEFMGRVTIVKLNDLDVDAIKRVMLESDESAIKIQQEIFDKLGVKLTFTDGFTTAIAQNAYDRKTGARGLNGIIDESTWKAFAKVYSAPQGEYEEVILDEETVNNPEHYQLVKKRSHH